MLKKFVYIFLLSSFLFSCSADNPLNSGRPPVTFTVHIENIANDLFLRTSSGKNEKLLFSPGVWIVYRDAAKNPLFSEGEKASKGLEVLAETGKPESLLAEMKKNPEVLQAGIFEIPIGAGVTTPTNASPGKIFEFSFKARPGTKLTFASMFIHSNDLFFSLPDSGTTLFSAGEEPLKKDISDQIILFDAGSEINQEPGNGYNQPLKQQISDSGETENSIIKELNEVKDGFVYPELEKIIRVTINNNEKRRN